MRSWQPVIGLETHVQLLTASKLFSNSPAEFSAKPNQNANNLDFGLPGTLPVLNREAVDMAIRFGIAIDAQISQQSWFARKHYFYPDLPKGYQISQYEEPVIVGGSIQAISPDGEQFSVKLVRAHLEEDAGKLIHDQRPDASEVDLNRAGVPLLEIVTEPTLHSAAEASAYGKALRELVCWLNICDGNMQEGSMRFDVNISLREDTDAELGTRIEVKNLNSFRFMEQAIEHEIERQSELLESGGAVEQETRLFDTNTGVTRAMRSKEDAKDYRYMTDPDLTPLLIDDTWIKDVADGMPELPSKCRERLQDSYGLNSYDVGVLTSDRGTVAYFEEVVNSCGDAKSAVNWVTGDLAALCNAKEIALESNPITAERLGVLIKMVIDGTISGKIAKQLLERMWQDPEMEPSATVEAENLTQISDAGELEKIVAKLIEENPKQAEQFRSGKDKLLGFFVGQAMKATKGQANPQQLNEIALKLLKDE